MTGMPHINGLTILIAVFIVAVIVIVIIFLRAFFHDPGERARPFREPPPERHHEWNEPAPARIPASLRYRYGTLGDSGPAPFEKEPQAPAAAVEQPPQAALPPPPATPGPGGLPEGDTRTLWPPQETTGPGDLPPMSPQLARWLQDAEDAQRWPDLMHGHGYTDATGSFERETLRAALEAGGA